MIDRVDDIDNDIEASENLDCFDAPLEVNDVLDLDAAVNTAELEEVLLNTEQSEMPRQAKKRSEFLPPPEITPEMTLFDYLRLCVPPLDKKLIEVAISQTKVPVELRNDAAQEIRIIWTQSKPDNVKYKPQQIAAYAHRMAGHACLRTRRDLGSATRLPGSAFRKKADGSTYVTPGVLAAPLDWNELESWFDTDGLADANTAQVVSLDDEALEEMLSDADASPAAEEDQKFNRRLERLESVKAELSDMQYEVMKRLIDGESYDEVRAALKLSKAALQRAISEAVPKVGEL